MTAQTELLARKLEHLRRMRTYLTYSHDHVTQMTPATGANSPQSSTKPWQRFEYGSVTFRNNREKPCVPS